VLFRSYFDEENQSLLMLRSGERLIQPIKDTFSGFFWIKDKQAGITHISTFKDSTNYDLVVQSAPRLLSEGIATTGVLNLDQVDTRAGVGISKTGNVIFYATDNHPWAGLSYQELRDIFIDLKASDIMCLDGGSSAQFKFNSNEISQELFGQRDIPFFISITAKSTFNR